jgi:hypothetical protein
LIEGAGFAGFDGEAHGVGRAGQCLKMENCKSGSESVEDYEKMIRDDGQP